MKTPEQIAAQIFDKDTVPPGPHGWIQWKGTDVCMDVRCDCGELTHVDAEFCYFLRCGACGKRYSVGAHIKLHELSPEEIEYVNQQTGGFITSHE